MEQLAYRVKQRHPGIFAVAEYVARAVTVTRFGRRLERVRVEARITGSVRGESAVIRPLGRPDTAVLYMFLTDQSGDRLRYFRPHGFQYDSVQRVLKSRAFLTYGLFVGDRLAGYALLKISPAGSAFIGLLLGREWTGIGLGRFLVAYLYWQASLAGLRARSTISRDNPSSLRSHEAVAPVRIVAELPNNYMLIEFPVGIPDPPTLDAGRSIANAEV